jgi:hypothetical protein
VDVEVPKLHAPLISFGSTSNKRESKRNDSQSRVDQTHYNTSFDTRENLTSLKPTKSDGKLLFLFIF